MELIPESWQYGALVRDADTREKGAGRDQERAEGCEGRRGGRGGGDENREQRDG